MKTTWFKHDTRSLSDDKLAALVAMYGAEGYGVFWAIVEALYEADGEPLTLLALRRIARDLGIESSKVIAIADYASSKDCGQLLQETDGAFQSTRVVKSLKKNEESAQQRREAIKKRWEKTENNDTSRIRAVYEPNTSRIQRREEERREEENNNITLSNTNVLSSVCGEPFSQLTADSTKEAPTESVFLVFPALKGKTCPITESQIKEWEETFPAVDVRQQVKHAKSWLEANPQKMKSNIKAFLNNWLTKEQNNAKGPSSDNKIKGTDIEMTFRPNSMDPDYFKDDVSFDEAVKRARRAK